MSQPANDEFSQHLSDEESNHEDASDTGAAPKQQQQMIPQTTAISNIKLLILKKEEYDIWAMEMLLCRNFKLLKKSGKAKNICFDAQFKKHMRRFMEMDVQKKYEKHRKLGNVQQGDTDGKKREILCISTRTRKQERIRWVCDNVMMLGDQEAHILALSQAVKKLEASL
ncbi:hypothetical protein Tco_0593987 [Tanacetum coccineum]